MLVTTLDRYVLAELARSLFIALLAILLIFALGTTFRLMRNELTYWQLLRSIPFAIVFTLPYALPLSLLIAVTLTFGRLVADREVLALEACGVAPRALAAPALGMGVVLTLVSLVLQSTVLPLCHRRTVEIGSMVLERMLELGEGEHWAELFLRDSFDIYVRKHEGRRLTGVVIHHDKGESPTTVVAERGRVEYDRRRRAIVLELEEVTISVFVRRDRPREGAPLEARRELGDPVRARLKRYVIEWPIASGSLKLKPSDYTSPQLRELIARDTGDRSFAAAAGQLTGASIANDDRLETAPAEFVSRIAMATAPLVFVLIGVPLTLALRAANRLIPLVAGTFAVSAFYMGPLLLGHTLSDRVDSSPYWPALADAVALPAAGGLAWLARRRGR